MKNLKIALFVVLNFAIITGVAYIGYYITNNQITNEDASASSETGLYLEATNEITSNLTVGQEIEIGVHTHLKPNDYASAAEIVIEYNATYLEAVSINEESSSMLGLFKNIDTPGQATIDVAIVGDGQFKDFQRIAKIKFKVKSVSTASTEVKISNASTLGVPDITTAGAYGNLLLPLNVPKNNGLTISNTGSSSAGYNIDQTVTLVVKADVAGTYPLDRAELIINYDKTKLSFEEFTSVTGLAIEYSGASSGQGKVYIDYATTGGSTLTNGQSLINIQFKVLALGSANTPVSIDASSKIGSPNTLSSSKLGSYNVPLLFSFCGDGTIQTPNAQGVNEVCDDGNTVNGDQCSLSCQNKCTAPAVWDGQKCSTPRAPFSGTAVTIPGVIPVANFDAGNNGVAYFDTTTGNAGNSNYRAGTDADISTYSGGGSAVQIISNFVNTEWMEYSVTTAATGQRDFQLQARAVSTNATEYSQIGLYIDGFKVGTFYVNVNGSFIRQNVMNVNLTSGAHVLRLEHLGGPQVEILGLKVGDLPIGCSGDYSGDGTVDVADLIIFAQNYNQQSIQCRYDLLGGNCYLDIVDLQAFATNYKQPNACSL